VTGIFLSKVNQFLVKKKIHQVSSGRVEKMADAAVTVHTGRGHLDKIYELAGDNAYTLSDLAAEISRQTGKNIPFQ
jgi:NAD(P)H dehydrogenase (quinone)